MADEKTSQITSTQALVDTDLFMMVHNMSTTPVSKGKAGSLVKTWIKAYLDTIYAPIAIATKVLYDSILASPAASFDITSIPAGYALLELHYTLKHSSTGTDMIVTLNNDGAGNYNYLKAIFDSASSPVTDAYAASGWNVGMAGSGDSAGYPSYGVFTFHNYDQTVFDKTGQLRSGRAFDDTASHQRLYDYHLLWKNTAAINRITLTAAGGNNFITGSRVTLVGIK